MSVRNLHFHVLRGMGKFHSPFSICIVSKARSYEITWTSDPRGINIIRDTELDHAPLDLFFPVFS